MANPFLEGSCHDEIETAIIYEKAYIHDIGKAVAYTDGNRLFLNTEDNLATILPNYNKDMLKWLLWHERYHMELKHHNRFFKYLRGLTEKDLEDEFHVTKNEVNIIMDILVHDSLSRMFPELVETAASNLAQFRNRNSLKYTFKTNNLEDMLDEYSRHKHGEDKTEGDTKDKTEETEEEKEDESGAGAGAGSSDGKDKTEKKDKKPSPKKKDEPKEEKSEEEKPSAKDGESSTEEKDGGNPESEHDKTDWSKLKEINTDEFIEEVKADMYIDEINRLKRKKIKLGKLTQKLNGLATTKRDRTYRLPSMLSMGDGCIFKGKTPGRVELYLIFDASGSMTREMDTFKEIISKSIPQAMNCPCEWFAGYGSGIRPYKTDKDDGYYKAQFKDFMKVVANSGYDDDGDRTIELCYEAEQKGFTPIGVTDGGGSLGWSKDKLKQLRKTILVGQNGYWLSKAKSINPSIQILELDI